MGTLKEINKRIIIDTYGTLEVFYSELEALSDKLPLDQSILIKEIQMYYDDLFDLEGMSIEKDMRQMVSVVKENLKTLKSIKLDDRVLKTLIELFEYNLSTLDGVRFINPSEN